MFNIATTKAKKELMALKESKSIPQDLRTWNIISIINKTRMSIFDQVDKNKNAIAYRGWKPLNRALRADPQIRATMTDEERERPRRLLKTSLHET